MQAATDIETFAVRRPIPVLQTDNGSLLFTSIDLQEELTSPYIAQLELTDVVQRGKTELALHDLCKCLPKPSMLSVRNMQNGLADMVSTGVQVLRSNGKLSITLEDYITFIRREQPTTVVAMADEVGAHCGKNRREKSFKRTIMWLNTLCEQKASLGCKVYAVCVGGTQIDYRRRCAQQIKSLEVDGVVIGELFCGETAAERRDCIRAVREVLGDELPLIVQGACGPLEVIELVQLGVSYIASNYPHTLTTASLALSWDLQLPTHPDLSSGANSLKRKNVDAVVPEKRQRAEDGAVSKSDNPEQAQPAESVVVNLLDRSNEMEHTLKLMPDCSCHTCRRPHSRAYIHHLLRAHELTADVLLYHHNQWQWLKFFDALRESLERGTLDDFESHMTKQFTGTS